MSGDQQVLGLDGEFARQLRARAAAMRSLAGELDAAAAGGTGLHIRGGAHLVGWAEVVLGDWPALVDELTMARAAGELSRLAGLSGIAEAKIGVVAGLRGDAIAARTHAARAEALAHGDRDIVFGVDAARALAAMSEGDATAAYESLRCAVVRDDEIRSGGRTAVLGLFAEMALRAGKRADARDLVGRLGIGADDESPADRCERAVARAMLCDDAGADAMLIRTIHDEAMAFPFARARLELTLGVRLRRARRVIDSRLHLRAARDVFEALQCIAWRDLASSELRAAGVADPCRAEPAVRLSPQEYEVATLAAAGLTNREIGQRLYLSPRTVGSHLYRIFPKLDITNRAQLANRLSHVAPIASLARVGVEAVLDGVHGCPQCCGVAASRHAVGEAVA